MLKYYLTENPLTSEHFRRDLTNISPNLYFQQATHCPLTGRSRELTLREAWSYASAHKGGLASYITEG
jgi:hypothetical protein